MTDIRGDRSRGGIALLVCAMTLLFAGCATPAAPQSTTATPTPTPTAACPQIEGVEMPPECAPYDPEKSMAQNDRYRERMDLSQEARAAAEEAIAVARPALEELRTSGALSTTAVQDALADAGLAGAYVRDDYGTLLFGADAPEGGCVFGSVTADALSIEAGGYIMDGGCLPAQ